MATSTSALARRASALGPRGAALLRGVLIPTSRSVDEGHAHAQVYTSSARNATRKFHPGAEKASNPRTFPPLARSCGCTEGHAYCAAPALSKKGAGVLWLGAGERLGVRPPPTATRACRSR